MVKLAGLAVGLFVSGELTLQRSLLSPALVVNVAVPPWMRRSTVQNRAPPELLLQVNVTFPLSGTTYPPGIGRASAESVTEKGQTSKHAICQFKHLTHRSNKEGIHNGKFYYIYPLTCQLTLALIDTGASVGMKEINLPESTATT